MNHPPAGRSLRWSDRWFAAIVALSINGLVIWFLDRGMSPLASVPSTPGGAIELVWIIRPPDEPPETTPILAATSSQPAARLPLPTGRPVERRIVNAPYVPSLHVAPTTPEPITTAESIERNKRSALRQPGEYPLTSDWTAGVPLDLGLPDALPTFQRDPLAHRIQPIRATPDRMRLAFRDRSIGGTLQRLAKNSICAELQRKLLGAEGRMEVVIEAMQEHGCIR